MKTHRRGTGIVIGLAVGLLTGALSVTRAQADQGMVQKTSPTSAQADDQRNVRGVRD